MNIPNSVTFVSGAVIFHDDSVLLVRKKSGLWAFPGGKVEKGDENIEATAIREVKEELGLDIDILRPLRTLVIDLADGSDLVIAAHFLSSYSGDISLKNEIEKFEWFDIHNLPQHDEMYPNIKEVIYSYLEEAK